MPRHHDTRQPRKVEAAASVSSIHPRQFILRKCNFVAIHRIFSSMRTSPSWHASNHRKRSRMAFHFAAIEQERRPRMNQNRWRFSAHSFPVASRSFISPAIEAVTSRRMSKTGLISFQAIRAGLPLFSRLLCRKFITVSMKVWQEGYFR